MLLLGAEFPTKCQNTLRELGIPYTILPENTALSSPLSAHPDISIFCLGDTYFTTETYFREISALFDRNNKKLVAVPEQLQSGYPSETLFGGFTLGKHLFCKTDSFSKTILRHAKTHGYQIHNVRQGYAKCAALTVKNELLISADAGLCRAAAPYGTVLQITPGHIALPPYACGFIGGASAVLKNCVLFFGNLDAHPDKSKINAALDAYGLCAVSLSKAPLWDCGSAVNL